MATHFQPAWRLRDGEIGDESALIEQSNWPSLEALKDIPFRVADQGRFEWTANGDEYGKQYFPPSISDMAYPSENLVAEMDYAGVDMAVLHRTPYLGIGNDFIADCVRRFPDRLRGLAHVEEWLVRTEPEASVEKVRRAIQDQGLSGLHFLAPQMDLYHPHEAWDGPEFRPFWDGVAALDTPVFFSLKERRDPKLESYLDELQTLRRWISAYPDVRVVLTHGLSWRLFVDGNRICLPEEVWPPFENGNLMLQLLFPISLGPVWDYPLAEVRPTIQECVNRIGADRLMWGTDMPIVMRYWTYRQNIDFIEEYCGFLNSDQKDAIMGQTTARLLDVRP